MTDKELAREIRKQRRLEKLGTNSPICGTCGETDYRVLEKHHVAGRKHDPDTVIICRNCHRMASDDQKDHPAIGSDADAMLSAIGMFLLGLADLLELVIDKLASFGMALIDRAKLAGRDQVGEARS